MPDLLQLPDEAANTQLSRYYGQIDDLTAQALSGDLYENDFRREYERLAQAALLLAFLLAGGDQNNLAAAAILAAAQKQATTSTNALTNDIYSGRYSANEDTSKGIVQTAAEGRAKLDNRLELWAASLGELYHLGMVYKPAASNLRWGVGNTEHCETCQGLDGVVLTREEWQFLGVRPQGPMLACHGYHCGCGLTETDEPSIGLENVRL